MGQQSVRRPRTRLDAGVGASCGLRSVCPGVARSRGIKALRVSPSDTELQRADRFVTEDGKAHFKQRRAFRRYCGAFALGSPRPLSRIAFKETEKGRPYLPDFPDVWFSFSSCRFGFFGAWSSTHWIGVDLEDQTRNLEAVELAQQFFSEAEVWAVKVVGGLARRRQR